MTASGIDHEQSLISFPSFRGISQSTYSPGLLLGNREIELRVMQCIRSQKTKAGAFLIAFAEPHLTSSVYFYTIDPAT